MYKVLLDIMLNGKFVKQLVFIHNPLFPAKDTEIKRFVEDRLPYLKGKGYNINFSNQRV